MSDVQRLREVWERELIRNDWIATAHQAWPAICDVLEALEAFALFEEWPPEVASKERELGQEYPVYAVIETLARLHDHLEAQL